jgi:hypothetical protein
VENELDHQQLAPIGMLCWSKPPEVMLPSNERGPIAESYDQLQSLPELHQARDRVPLPSASLDSLNRTTLQAAEIALLNIHDLLNRASADIQSSMLPSAARKLSWAAGFHRLLIELSLLPPRTAALETRQPVAVLSVAESRAYRVLRLGIRRFDRTVIEHLGGALEAALEDPSGRPHEAEIAHLARMCSHESGIWERNLLSIPFRNAPGKYPKYIAADLLRRAVRGFSLTPETYLMQFRAVHQIPELLAMECCDHLRAAVPPIRDSRRAEALCRLSCASQLLHVITFSLRPIVENLTTADYHEIRENLGLTSGSHSVALRYKLFQELYAGCAGAALSTGYFDSPDAECCLVAAEILRIRSSIALWRDLHVHLPRNNLGGAGESPTRSLIGSADALPTVEQMQADALRRDPLREVATRLKLEEQRRPALTRYAQSESSLDTHLRQCTARMTQRRFREVQERSGYFSGRPRFVPPPLERI